MNLNRLALFVSQFFFSVITPPLLVPGIGKLKLTRSFIAFFFGRSYGNRYQSIIDAFQGRYGLAMTEGLKKAANRRNCTGYKEGTSRISVLPG